MKGVNMSESNELTYEPAPGSMADLDYEMWQKYLEVCKAQEVRPSIRDYVIWLDEQQ